MTCSTRRPMSPSFPNQGNRPPVLRIRGTPDVLHRPLHMYFVHEPALQTRINTAGKNTSRESPELTRTSSVCYSLLTSPTPHPSTYTALRAGRERTDLTGPGKIRGLGTLAVDVECTRPLLPCRGTCAGWVPVALAAVLVCTTLRPPRPSTVLYGGRPEFQRGCHSRIGTVVLSL